MRYYKLIFVLFLFVSVLEAQDQPILKNADFSEMASLGDGTAQDGMPVKYVSYDGKIARSLTGKEFTYVNNVNDLLLSGINSGWISTPNWKKKYSWRLDELYTIGLYREKSQDQALLPTAYSINNIIQPAKGHPLYQYFVNQNDSLYQPNTDVANTKAYLMKVQDFENNSPRLNVVLHVNDNFRVTSISDFEKEEMKLRLKSPYAVYHKNDSIWFKETDIISQENNELRFQKNSLIIIIGNPESISKGKGIVDGFSEYWMEASGKSGGEDVNRLNQIMIELTGHPKSIELFLNKINWKQIDKAFKYKLK
ncbi:MAG: hypothetical protein AB7O73_01260 [Bacteroidia bacterium]